jgi:tetratricopeptide (TPR) repeat protein
MTVQFRSARPFSVRQTLAAVAIGLMPLASASSGFAAAPAATPAVLPGLTLTGNYLAARHASKIREDSDAAAFLMSALDQSPDDPVLINRAYLTLLLDGRVPEATLLARRVMDTDPDSTLARVVVATDDIRAGRFAEADEALAAMPEGRISLFLSKMLRGWTLSGLGQPEQGIAELRVLDDQQGEDTLFHFHAALISEAAGSPEEALSHARAAVEGERLSLVLVQLLGGVLERSGAPDEASALRQRYLDEHLGSSLVADALSGGRDKAVYPPDMRSAGDGAALALFDAVGALSRQNTPETALVLGQLGLHLQPDFPALRMLVADLMEILERREQANRMYATIDPASPLARQARLNTALNLNRMDRHDEAVTRLRKLAGEDPGDAEPLVDLGDILRGREAFAEAVEAYDEAIARIPELQPYHWRLLYARGIALERANRWPRAEKDFLKALEFEPDQPFVLNYLGYSWIEQRLNLDEAQAMIRKAVEQRPDDGYIVDSLGWGYYQLGKYEDAVRELERAVELRPQDAVINDHLGDAYWAVGRQREARFQWTRALGLEPDAELKSRLEDKLDKGLVKEANAAHHE